MSKKIIITGGAGFIGSHFVKLILKNTDWEVINVDLLSYAGNLENLIEVENNPKYLFYKVDVANKIAMSQIFEKEKPDHIAHFAAETHVDNSIKDPLPFLKTNILGTQVLLELAKKYNIEKFVHVSTDEVYGDWPLDSTEKFTEESPLHTSSPYSASKASSDLLALSYFRTFDLPVVISRCTNNYGTYQYPEKLIPLFVKKLLSGKKVPVYGNGQNIREWIAVSDHCRAILFLLKNGKNGEIYNIGSGVEKNNLEITQKICENLGFNPSEKIDFVIDRKGHDRRYAVDSNKIRKLGYQNQEDFEDYFQKTVLWYKNKFSL